MCSFYNLKSLKCNQGPHFDVDSKIDTPSMSQNDYFLSMFVHLVIVALKFESSSTHPRVVVICKRTATLTQLHLQRRRRRHHHSRRSFNSYYPRSQHAHTDILQLNRIALSQSKTLHGEVASVFPTWNSEIDKFMIYHDAENPRSGAISFTFPKTMNWLNEKKFEHYALLLEFEIWSYLLPWLQGEIRRAFGSSMQKGHPRASSGKNSI